MRKKFLRHVFLQSATIRRLPGSCNQQNYRIQVARSKAHLGREECMELIMIRNIETCMHVRFQNKFYIFTLVYIYVCTYIKIFVLYYSESCACACTLTRLYSMEMARCECTYIKGRGPRFNLSDGGGGKVHG